MQTNGCVMYSGIEMFCNKAWSNSLNNLSPSLLASFDCECDNDSILWGRKAGKLINVHFGFIENNK